MAAIYIVYGSDPTSTAIEDGDRWINSTAYYPSPPSQEEVRQYLEESEKEEIPEEPEKIEYLRPVDEQKLKALRRHEIERIRGPPVRSIHGS